MQITASQLQTHHKMLIDALKRGEQVEITYHGQRLGVIHPEPIAPTLVEKETAMAAFFGMHKDMDGSSDVVEAELRAIRKGRRKQLDAI